MAAPAKETLHVAGRDVILSNPAKILFPQAGYTKVDLARYYIAVAGGALRAAGDRPNVLVRYPNGVGGEFFYQKRAPESRPDWIDVVALRFPSGRTAEEVVPRHPAALVWMANLACLELHPHPVRADDLDHPDELRVDLDPVPGVRWEQVREVAGVVRATLNDLQLVGWPKTSGSRGIHIYIRIHRRWTFDHVRRAALALAREVERRAPGIATSKWWKEERHGVFLDYNQNAKDRTIAAAYSVRATADARVPFDEGRLIASLIPGARFVPLDSANHLTLDTEPAWARWVDEVRAFLPAASTGGAFAALTPRERDLVELIAQGRDNAQAAALLGLSEKTVRNHITSIFAKLSVENRSQAIVLARNAGFGRQAS